VCFRGREAIVPRLKVKALEGQRITTEVPDKAIRPLIGTTSTGAPKRADLR
jgi:hypothetical protein